MTYTWEITYEDDKGKIKQLKIDMDVCIQPSSVKVIQLYNKYLKTEYNPISYKEYVEDKK